MYIYYIEFNCFPNEFWYTVVCLLSQKPLSNKYLKSLAFSPFCTKHITSWWFNTTWRSIKNKYAPRPSLSVSITTIKHIITHFPIEQTTFRWVNNKHLKKQIRPWFTFQSDHCRCYETHCAPIYIYTHAAVTHTLTHIHVHWY